METNDNSQQVEQITDDSIIEKIPKDLKVRDAAKLKNPRKVAAGKALAERNVKRRAEAMISNKKESDGVNIKTIFNGIQNLALLVSSGFILYHGYNFVKGSIKKSDSRSRNLPNREVTETISDLNIITETPSEIIIRNDMYF